MKNLNELSTKLLKFSLGNSKLDGKTLIFDLPAGYACPFARDCRSCVDLETGKIKDGPHTKFRCFGASSEARFKQVWENHWYNYNLLKTAGFRSPRKMADLIEASLAGMKFAKVRIHANGGDFFSLNYFKAWCLVARNHPDKIFYAYSKAIPIITREDLKPDNVKVTASWGGTHDELLEQLGYPSARVVYSKEEAEELGLEIDHDDSHAVAADHDFALLIHGTQPAGSDASKAREALRRSGWSGYSRKKGAKK